jgi:hypothetical protein
MARILCKSGESLDDDQKSNSDDDERRKSLKDHQLIAEDAIDEEETFLEIKINDHDVKKTDDGNCLENLNEAHENDEDDDVVILRNKKKPKLRKQNQLSKSTRLERNRLKSTTAVDKHIPDAEGAKMPKTSPPFKVPDEFVVCIKKARFSWCGGNSAEAANLLEIENLLIPKGIV